MEDKLRRYVDGLFARTAPTMKAVEFKEEMLQNLQDKYNDLIAEGRSPEAAYNIAIAGVGDIGDLLSDLDVAIPEPPDYEELEQARNKSAMLTAIAVTAIILSVLPLIVLTMFGSRFATRIGLPVMLVTIAAASGLLVYNNMTKPRFQKDPNTIVGQFREWQADKHDRRRLRGAISAAMWTLTTALYIIISFGSHRWAITWVMFLFAAALEAFISIIFTLKK